MENFDYDLQKHLNKCELEFRAKKLPSGSSVSWLAHYCNSVHDIAKYLRSLGFRISEVVDETDSSGDRMQWVETTNGIIVYVNGDGARGFVAAASKSRA